MTNEIISIEPLQKPTCPGLDDSKVPRVFYPSKNGQDPARQHTVIFYIPGNPGLVSYYNPFFETLRSRLDEIEARTPHAAVHIYSQNLIGFSDEDHKPFGGDNREPFTLAEQISHITSRVEQLRINGKHPDQIILMGHSVGAYISIEVFDAFAKRGGDASKANLRAGILLFPTVTDIAKSPSGTKLDYLRAVSFLDQNAHHIAKGFVDLWPAKLLGVFLRRVMGFTVPAGQTTLDLLQSRDGIWQGIHLGKDEMQTITEDKWSDDLWEINDQALAEKHDVPKFFFYFGVKDHWVAEEFRDEFIRRRNDHAARDAPKHKQGRTRIVIDEHNTPHAFCIHHSELVAEKISVWIDELAGSTQ